MERNELGPAEVIINALLAYTDHMVHNRPGVVSPDPTSKVGTRWVPATYKAQEGDKVVFQKQKVGMGRKQRTNLVKLGNLQDNNDVKNGRVVGRYQKPGLYEEVAVWMYRQVADVWKVNNEFAARWASYQFKQEHKDLKVVLAAFMLVQSRKGDPVVEGGEILFNDEDFRDVGEAMCLLYSKEAKGLDPKLLLRVFRVLWLPEVAKINYELGFAKSDRRPFLGRWPKVVEKWLRFREQNPAMLQGLVKAGFKGTVAELARRIGYKPTTEAFFEAMGWKQHQAADGRRQLAIGLEMAKAESWSGLTEMEICQRIEKDKPGWKQLTGRLPKEIGLTRGIMACAMDNGCLSAKDIQILSPTIEELGLLEVQEYRAKWEAALKQATDMRAMNIAKRMKSQEASEKLDQAADEAVQKQVEEVMKDLRVMVIIDISASMDGALDGAMDLIPRLIQSIPLDRLHVSVFNTTGAEVKIKHGSSAGVRNALKGIRAQGGTHYVAGVMALQHCRPKDGEELVMIFIGDEEQTRHFAQPIRDMDLNPVAFGLMRIVGGRYSHGNGTVVRDTASQLEIPCFEIEKNTFDDVYAIPRTMRNLIAATPVGVAPQRALARAPRVTLVDSIMKTELLEKPAWA